MSVQAWTREESMRLIQLRQLSWDFPQISQVLGRTVHACKRHFYRVHMQYGCDPLLDKLREVHKTPRFDFYEGCKPGKVA